MCQKAGHASLELYGGDGVHCARRARERRNVACGCTCQLERGEHPQHTEEEGLLLQLVALESALQRHCAECIALLQVGAGTQRSGAWLS